MRWNPLTGARYLQEDDKASALRSTGAQYELVIEKQESQLRDNATRIEALTSSLEESERELQKARTRELQHSKERAALEFAEAERHSLLEALIKSSSAAALAANSSALAVPVPAQLECLVCASAKLFVKSIGPPIPSFLTSSSFPCRAGDANAAAQGSL